MEPLTLLQCVAQRQQVSLALPHVVALPLVTSWGNSPGSAPFGYF